MTSVSELQKPEESSDEQEQNGAAPSRAKKPIDKGKSKPPMTTGEKWYEAINFTLGKICILAATAAIAYVAAYGKEKYGPVPNPLRKLMNAINGLRGPWGEEADRLASAVRQNAPGVTQADSTKADFKAIFGGSLAGAVILWWGGTSFAPIMRTLENSKEGIANWFNRKCGKPGEVEIAHERLKDNPQQTWGDMLKGRIAAFVFAFTAFSTTCFLLGRVKTPTDKGNYLLKFDYYEEKVGRMVAGMSKSGQTIGQTPMTIELTPDQKTSPLYRLGKIFAIDFYATSLAIVVWNFTSRRSARKRQESIQAAVGAIAVPSHPVPSENEAASQDSAPEVSERKTDKAPIADQFPKAMSHSQAVQTGKNNELALAVG